MHLEHSLRPVDVSCTRSRLSGDSHTLHETAQFAQMGAPVSAQKAMLSPTPQVLHLIVAMPK